MRYVIIGNGVAGVTAADAMRRLDPEGSITFIARENFSPYCRPMISNILAGTAELDELPIRSGDYYDALGARALPGIEATGVDTRRIDAENLELENIFFMRTVQEVLGMVRALPDTEHALVLGGGLVGFKAAYGFLNRGNKVSILFLSGYPLSFQVDETAGGIIQSELERYGLEVRTGVEVTAFEGDESGRVRGATLSDGTSMDCDIVVVGKGVFPARSYLGQEFQTDAGILVNDYLTTSVPDVWAAGDIAEHRDVARRRPWLNPLWPVAVEMGRVAGSNMAGHPMRY